jgi:hypothetical protein
MVHLARPRFKSRPPKFLMFLFSASLKPFWGLPGCPCFPLEHRWTYSLNKYLLGIYWAAGTSLPARDLAVNTNTNSYPGKMYILVGWREEIKK